MKKLRKDSSYRKREAAYEKRRYRDDPKYRARKKARIYLSRGSPLTPELVSLLD